MLGRWPAEGCWSSRHPKTHATALLKPPWQNAAGETFGGDGAEMRELW